MTIDSMDAHDGHKLVKGHVGSGVLPALLAFCQAEQRYDDREFLTCLVLGYEIGTRAGIALHQTACDYHTSGAWVSIATAAIGARALGLSPAQTREAMGIAEYHGPRSQMMRVIDSPTMVKDGSGWGAMAGVSAAYLAAKGFTGAPAVLVEDPALTPLWSDLGECWRIREQYFKPYPVCRWAQPAIEAALSICKKQQLDAAQIDHIEVSTFHEAKRLGTTTPINTEQAQYSLPFATAAAIVFRKLGSLEVSGDALLNSEVLRLSCSMQVDECDEFNQAFPQKRFAELCIVTKQGDRFKSGPTQARGDPEAPLSNNEIEQKFHQLCADSIGARAAEQIKSAVYALGSGKDIQTLIKLITKPA
jgi:2-methylcitrate dehydratase PrpD